MKTRHTKTISTLVVLLVFAACPQVFASELNQGNQVSDFQFQANRCDAAVNREDDLEKEFIAACTTAGLGATLEICSDRLEECTESSSEGKSYCLNHAITADEDDRIQTRIDSIEDAINDLHADSEEAQMQVVELAKRRDAANTKLEETLQSIEDQKTAALEAEVSKMNSITDNIASQHDKLNALQLELREFVVTKSVSCHEEASKVKAEYVAERRRRAANGQRAHLTQSQLIGRTGLSVNEASVIKYNRHMKNCTATSTKSGLQTVFGQQYRLKRAQIRTQQNIIKREINRLTAQRVNVKRETKRLIFQLNRKQASLVSAHSRDLSAISAEVAVLEQKGSRIERQLLSKTLELRNASGESRLSLSNAISTFASGRTSTQQRNVASNSKIEAFTTANSLLEQIRGERRSDSLCHIMSDQLPDNTDAPIVTADLVE